MPQAEDSGRPEAHAPPVRDGGGTPRWVKVFAAVGLLLLILVAILLLAGHGPSQHFGHALVLVPSQVPAA